MTSPARRVHQLMIGEFDLGAELGVDPANGAAFVPLRMHLVAASVSLLAHVVHFGDGHRGRSGAVGSGHHNIVPYRALATSNGWVVLAVIGDKYWPRLFKAIGLDDLGGRSDPRTNPPRTAALHEILCPVSDVTSAEGEVMYAVPQRCRESNVNSTQASRRLARRCHQRANLPGCTNPEPWV